MVPGYDPGQARTTLAGLTKPDPKERAAQIVAWAICWPWNLVWTLCVYNPFRYVGEFLLREIQSALFEISNGQFRSIERDLTLEPLPPPYPIPERQSQEVTTETPSVATVEAEPFATQSQGPGTTPGSATAHSTTVEVVVDPHQSEPISDQPSDTPTVAEEASNEQSVEHIPVEVEAELAEGGSSDSYTWEPPEPTAYVPLSDRPLKAVKYETGSNLPPTPEKQTMPEKQTASEKPKTPAEPAADPWFGKQATNR